MEGAGAAPLAADPGPDPICRTMLRSLLRRLRGALGLGAFGAAGFVAFGTFVKGVAFLLHGTPPGLLGSILPLATGGFITGILASVGVMVASRGGREPGDLRVLLLGLPIAAAVVAVLWGEPLVRLGVAGLVPFAVLTGVGGAAIGVVGAAALKIAQAAPDPPAPVSSRPPGDRLRSPRRGEEGR